VAQSLQKSLYMTNKQFFSRLAMSLICVFSANLFAADTEPKVFSLFGISQVRLFKKDAADIMEHLSTMDPDKKTRKAFNIVSDVLMTGTNAPRYNCTKVPYDPNEPSLDRANFTNPLWWMGNVQEPKAPDWYKPGDKLRNLLWYIRNPFHNFTNYVIGVRAYSRDPSFIRCGHYPADVFSPNPGWNYSEIQYQGVRLPFVSYWSDKFKFYIGWRERGNFGLKLNQVGN